MRVEKLRYYFAKADDSPFLSRLVVVLLLPVVALLLCGVVEIFEYLHYPTADNVEAAIRQQLPSGTDKAVVVQFLHQYKFSFSDGSADEWAKSFSDFHKPRIEAKIGLIKSYIKGNTTVAEPFSLGGCWSEVTFFFDVDGKLIDSVVSEHCDSL
ncbi:MAG: hypothetical protein HYR56_05130 [Acidobacteria bacterium]|nr:hypothetical protein [Acidobacteriota bacterium]MBI3423649.1 hypothetical protein [Acidobacteriota bacterium]